MSASWTCTKDGLDCLVLTRGRKPVGGVWRGARTVVVMTPFSRSQTIEHGWKAARWLPEYKSLGWCKGRETAQQKVMEATDGQ